MRILLYLSVDKRKMNTKEWLRDMFGLAICKLRAKSDYDEPLTTTNRLESIIKRKIIPQINPLAQNWHQLWMQTGNIYPRKLMRRQGRLNERWTDELECIVANESSHKVGRRDESLSRESDSHSSIKDVFIIFSESQITFCFSPRLTAMIRRFWFYDGKEEPSLVNQTT